MIWLPLSCRTVKTDIVRRPSTNSLFRRGSTFRFSGRTQFKLLQEGTQTKRPSRRFERYCDVTFGSTIHPSSYEVLCDVRITSFVFILQVNKPKSFCKEDHLIHVTATTMTFFNRCRYYMHTKTSTILHF